ncbi:hypothetical protein DIKCMJMK_02110 [Shewanella oneidensis]|nr:hypothetical protein [Shewanella oneidensis]
MPAALINKSSLNKLLISFRIDFINSDIDMGNSITDLQT